LAGYYCYPGATAAIACPDHSTSPPEATSVSECTGCEAGYHKIGNTSCRACRPGYACPDLEAETICPKGQFAPLASTACQGCPVDTYAAAAGSALCAPCSSNGHAPANSDSKQDCQCEAGYYRDMYLDCYPCPGGQKCSDNQMQGCPRGTSSPGLASACTTCPIGTFSGAVGQSKCLDCPAGAVVNKSMEGTEFNAVEERLIVHPTSDKLYVMRDPISASQGKTLTKWSFYSTAVGACTVTPVILQASEVAGDRNAIAMTVGKVGTTRTVVGQGAFTRDFEEGAPYEVPVQTPTGQVNVYYYTYFGWAFEGATCIPHSTTGLNTFVIGKDYTKATLLGSAVNFDSFSKETWSVQLTYEWRVQTPATAGEGTTSIFNCSCGAGSLQMADGNCKGMCVDGMYLAKPTDAACTPCTQGYWCTKSVRAPCPSGYSSPPGAASCTKCDGPGTRSNIELVMCGLKTCAAASPVPVGGTGWRGLGQITTGLGGSGQTPRTPWYSGYKALGLVLNATADRPVALLQQTLTVVVGQTYALRFKVACSGDQCAARFVVTWQDGTELPATLWSTSQGVKRSFVEQASPYFTPTSPTITIRFTATMTTSSATVWLARVELVDLGAWLFSVEAQPQLQNGVDFPVRYSGAYVQEESQVLMRVSNYIQQTVTVIPGYPYELTYWTQGGLRAQWLNGTVWVDMAAADPIDVALDPWYQAVWLVTPRAAALTVRLVGAGALTPPRLVLWEPLEATPCMSCLADYWCTGNALNRCPLNTISNASAMMQTECYCRPGYFGKVELGGGSGYSPCSICPTNFYCNGGNQIAPCPPGHKSQPGATLDRCTLCPEYEYCENGQVGFCPIHSYSLNGSNDIHDCDCVPGYYGASGNCTQCEPGFYCPGKTVRRACTLHAVSPPGSTAADQCFCDRGWVGTNNTACTPCPEGKWCWTGRLNDCPQNTWSPAFSSFQVECISDYGYTGANGYAGNPCSQGLYKDARGNASCSACPVGTSSAAIAATSNATCAPCSYGHFSPYTGVSACLPCQAGYATAVLGSTSCAVCVPGTWSPEGVAHCSLCVAGTWSVTVGASDVSTCKICATGSYSSAGSTVCTLCGACAYWYWPMRVSATVDGRNQVAFGSVGSNLQSYMTLVSDTLALVSDGAALFTINIATKRVAAISLASTDWKPDTRSFAHIEASRDRYSVYVVQDNVYRLAWPELTYLNAYAASSPMGVTESEDGMTLFITEPTQILHYDPFIESIIENIKYPVASVQGSPCAHPRYPNTLFVAGRSSVTAFGFRRYSTVTKLWTTINADVTAVKCTFTPDGNYVILSNSINGAWMYGMIEGTLVKAITAQINGVLVDPTQSYILLAKQAVGLIQLPISILASRACGPGLYSDQPGLESVDQCMTCPAGSLCPGGSNITQCVPGSFGTDMGFRSQGQCAVCPAGHYCTGGPAISVCPLGSYSMATSVTVSTDCGRCLAGFYCPNATTIKPCPANTNSPAGSTDLVACSCNAGYRCTVTNVVHAEVTLPVTIADFQAMQAGYILAVARAAGVDPSQVVIVSITSASTGGRRLLSLGRASIEVHTSIYGSAHAAQPHLAIATLDAHLLRNGLPPQERDARVSLHKEVQHAVRVKKGGEGK
jgi:hypothetical protein